jgi:hypothetical protein
MIGRGGEKGKRKEAVVLNREGAAEKRIAKTNTKTADALPTRV